MKVFDITIPLSPATPVWAGEKGVKITRVESICAGDDFNVSRFEMGVHAGTHMDAPYHLANSGRTVDQIALEQLAGKTQVLKIPDEIERVTAEVIKCCEFKKGIRSLLLKTRNSRYWKEEPCRFREDFTALDSSAAEALVSKGIKLVGIDWFSISSMDDLIKPHKILLDAGVVVVENLDLGGIKPGVYTLFCLPLKLMGTDGAPVRAILTQDD